MRCVKDLHINARMGHGRRDEMMDSAGAITKSRILAGDWRQIYTHIQEYNAGTRGAVGERKAQEYNATARRAVGVCWREGRGSRIQCRSTSSSWRKVAWTRRHNARARGAVGERSSGLKNTMPEHVEQLARRRDSKTQCQSTWSS